MKQANFQKMKKISSEVKVNVVHDEIQENTEIILVMDQDNQTKRTREDLEW